MKIMDAEQRMLTKPGQVCYTITSGMSLKDFKRDAINAYYNRDAETLNRLLDSLGPV
jgi:hypothetical protein